MRPESDELVLNLGDLFSIWTRGRWRSVKHRVVQISDCPCQDSDFRPEDDLLDCFQTTEEEEERERPGRLSFAYFVNMDKTAMVDCNDFTNPGDEVCQTPPFNSYEYLLNKFDQSQIQLNNEE